MIKTLPKDSHDPLMQHPIHRQTKHIPVRWGVVIKAVLAVCAVALVACAVWYVVAILVPRVERANSQRQLDEMELSALRIRMVRIEAVLHLQ
jgi:hypothetical protein